MWPLRLPGCAQDDKTTTPPSAQQQQRITAVAVTKTMDKPGYRLDFDRVLLLCTVR